MHLRAEGRQDRRSSAALPVPAPLAAGDGLRREGGRLGGPAFLAQLDPPLVGSELWVYLEEKKKVLVVTCIELRTGGKLPDNAHFPDCVFAAAHAALVKLL